MHRRRFLWNIEGTNLGSGCDQCYAHHGANTSTASPPYKTCTGWGGLIIRCTVHFRRSSVLPDLGWVSYVHKFGSQSPQSGLNVWLAWLRFFTIDIEVSTDHANYDPLDFDQQIDSKINLWNSPLILKFVSYWSSPRWRQDSLPVLVQKLVNPIIYASTLKIWAR